MAALAALFASAASCSCSSAAAETARLNAIFSACAQGRSIAKDEELAIRAIGGNLAARYGEITPRGFRTLAARLEIGERDIFADLGSGVGKACHQAVQEYNVRAACGVELSKTRHDRAVERWLATHFPPRSSSTSFQPQFERRMTYSVSCSIQSTPPLTLP